MVPMLTIRPFTLVAAVMFPARQMKMVAVAAEVRELGVRSVAVATTVVMRYVAATWSVVRTTPAIAMSWAMMMRPAGKLTVAGPAIASPGPWRAMTRATMPGKTRTARVVVALREEFVPGPKVTGPARKGAPLTAVKTRPAGKVTIVAAGETWPTGKLAGATMSAISLEVAVAMPVMSGVMVPRTPMAAAMVATMDPVADAGGRSVMPTMLADQDNGGRAALRGVAEAGLARISAGQHQRHLVPQRVFGRSARNGAAAQIDQLLAFNGEARRTIAAALLRTLQLALEGLADQFLPLGLLFGSQQGLGLFIGRLAQFLELLPRRGPIAAATAALECAAHFALNGAELFLLLRGQLQRFGDFRIGQRAGASLLQGDLL